MTARVETEFATQEKVPAGSTFPGPLLVLFLSLFLVPVPSVEAEVMIPRNPDNAYQKSAHGNLRHVLLYDKAPGHANGRNALRRSLARTAQQYGFRLDTSQVSGYINDSTLAGVDIVVFSNGDADVLGPRTSVATLAMERFVYEQGGALLMVHAANAFLVCGSSPYQNPSHGPEPATFCAFLARASARQYYHHQPAGTPVTVYVDSVGAGEIPPHGSLGGTPPVPPAAVTAHGIRNPETRNIFTGLPRTWTGLEDEWYEFRFSPRLIGDIPHTVAHLDSTEYIEGQINVLLSIDERSHDWGGQRMGDHPIVWTRKMGKGLAAVNNAGHDDVYVQNDSVMEKFNGRLLRYLARDFVGCMDPAYAEYNPEASVTLLSAGFDDPEPCKTAVSLRPRLEAHQAGYAVLAGAARRIRVALPQAGRHEIRVTDVSGETVFSRTVAGDGTAVESPALRPGIYFVRILGPGNARLVERVDLY